MKTTHNNLLHVTAIIALLLFLQPAPPNFTARWVGMSVARLSWQQPADVRLTCLFKRSTLIRCWPNLPAGATYTTSGTESSFNGNLRPHAGDVYSLTLDSTTWRADLRGVVALAMIRR